MNSVDVIEFCPLASLVVDVMPSHSEWGAVVREEWQQLRAHYQGLGASLVTASVESSAVDDHCIDFVAEARDCLRQRQLSQVSVQNFEPSLEGDCRIDRGWLGQYAIGGGAPVIRLWIDKIEDAAGRLGCDWKILLRIVLRHELGHHLAPASDHELSHYDSNGSNPWTCRVEGAAQLFAWITSDNSDRLIIKRLAEGQTEAYREYQKYLTFARQTMNVWDSARRCSSRPGWLLAWRLASFGRDAAKPPRARSRISETERERAAPSTGTACICFTIWPAAKLADRKFELEAQTTVLEASDPCTPNTELEHFPDAGDPLAPSVYESLGGRVHMAAISPESDVVWFWVLEDGNQMPALKREVKLILESSQGLGCHGLE
jgi:hypothetical protein